MTISGFTDDDVKRVLAENLTPSDSIKSPERLFGRQRNLVAIDRALNSPGRQVFIYGDRGVGKTSLALTAAFAYTDSSTQPIHINCGTTTTFGQAVQAIGLRAIPVRAPFETSGKRGSLGLTIAGTGGAISPGEKPSFNMGVPESLEEALNVVRYVSDIFSHRKLVVVVDEMERLRDGRDREMFAEFIKNVGEVTTNVKFIFCGIGSDLTEILGNHPSAGRILETIALDKLHHDSLWQIIQTPADKLGVRIDREKLIRIGQISDGFPHYVHLIGESLFWAMFDDVVERNSVTVQHFKAAIRLAIERAEAILRTQFDKATKKTKNTSDYEETLWALADRTSDRRQLTDIYETSYVRIMLTRSGRELLPKEKLNQRLLVLRSEGHGHIVKGYGSGWFGFRENIMRGYVRLDAENRGVILGQESV